MQMSVAFFIFNPKSELFCQLQGFFCDHITCLGDMAAVIAEGGLIEIVCLGIKGLLCGNITAIGIAVFDDKGVLEGRICLDVLAECRIDLTREADKEHITHADALYGEIGGVGLLFGEIVHHVSCTHEAWLLGQMQELFAVCRILGFGAPTGDVDVFLNALYFTSCDRYGCSDGIFKVSGQFFADVGIVDGGCIGIGIDMVDIAAGADHKEADKMTAVLVLETLGEHRGIVAAVAVFFPFHRALMAGKGNDGADGLAVSLEQHDGKVLIGGIQGALNIGTIGKGYMIAVFKLKIAAKTDAWRLACAKGDLARLQSAVCQDDGIGAEAEEYILISTVGVAADLGAVADRRTRVGVVGGDADLVCGNAGVFVYALGDNVMHFGWESAAVNDEHGGNRALVFYNNGLGIQAIIDLVGIDLCIMAP